MSLTSWQYAYKDPLTFIVQASSMNVDDAWMPFPIGMQYSYGHVTDARQAQIGAHEKLLLCAFDPATDQHRRPTGKNRRSILATLETNGIHNTHSHTYFRDLPSYKFVVSPEGNGIDCHRHYEALMAGCIPIIERNPLTESKYAGCPVLWTDDYSEITHEYLERVYAEMLTKTYDFSRLRLGFYDFATRSYIKECGNFWMNRILHRPWYDVNRGYVGVAFAGGLGNMLFQLAALQHMSLKTGRVPRLHTVGYSSPHSSLPYWTTILSKWAHMPTGHFDRHIYEGVNLNYNPDLIDSVNSSPSPLLVGYFQDYTYVEPDFADTLVLPTEVLAKYPDIRSKVFIHVRGGDYLTSPAINMNLDTYVTRAIAKFPGASFVIFTDDEPYLLTRPWLQGLDYTIIRENELDTLTLMSKCAGAICAHSTFSWWGAWLNRNRTIVFPSRWVNASAPHKYEGMYFPGVEICDVD